MNKYSAATIAVTAVTSFLLGTKFACFQKKNAKGCKETSKPKTIKETFSAEEEYTSDEESDMESVDEFLNAKAKEYSALNDEVRLAICIRKDLKMTKGKTIAQSCHATLACFRSLNNSLNGPMLLDKWIQRGQAKITLQIDNEEHLQELWFKAKELGVMACPIRDAGRTQVEPGTITVIGIGPAPKSVLDQITGDLKLY